MKHILFHLHKHLNALEKDFPILSVRVTLILCANSMSTSVLNSLNFRKNFDFLAFNAYNHTFLEKSSMSITKYLCTTHGHYPYSEAHVRIHDFQRLNRSPPPPVRKRCPLLFAFDAHFINQQRCWTRNFAEVHTTHHVMECMNTFYIKLAKAAVPKFKRVIFLWSLHQVGYFRFVHLYKNYFIKVIFVWCNRNGFTTKRVYNAFVSVRLDFKTVQHKFFSQKIK